jgi:hypothetical protein
MRTRLFAAFIAILAVVGQTRAQAPSPVPAPAVPAPPLAPGALAPPLAPPATDDWSVPAPAGGRAWVEADFLLWWMRGTSLPPLVTGSPPGTPIAQAGVLGTPGATVLFGGNDVNGSLREGGRIAVGYWFNDAHDCGVEAEFFMLTTKATDFAAASSGNPILSRPFIDANSGLPSSERIAFPGDTNGSVTASAATTGLLGAGILGRENLCLCCCVSGLKVDALFGYRFLRLADHVVVNEDLVNVNPNNPNFIPVGTTLLVTDRFASRNVLNALDFGLDCQWQDGPVTVAVRTRFAVGFNDQVVDVFGATTVTVPGMPPVVNSGGLLALADNLGHHSRREVSVVPEVDLKLAYQLTPRLTASLGYTFLFWERVVRADGQIDPTVNPTLIPPPTNVVGPLRPTFAFQNTNFYAQGIDLGLTFIF